MQKMNKIISSGLLAGVVLLILSVLGLYVTIWYFPKIAEHYFDPMFDTQSNRYMIYFLHPFIISFALSWFWQRFKGVLTGSFLTRGVEFGLIYTLIAILPMMWLIYSAINVSLDMVATWLVLGLFQGIISGLVFEKTNP
jgi:hypothetical protein